MPTINATKPPIKQERRADEDAAKKRHSVFVAGFKPERVHKTRLSKNRKVLLAASKHLAEQRMVARHELHGLPSVMLPTVISPSKSTSPRRAPLSLQQLVELQQGLLQSITAVGRVIEQMAAADESGVASAALVSATPTGLEPPSELASARAQAAQARKALIRSKAILPSGEITERLEMSRQALNKAIHANRLFALEFDDTLYYPSFFADLTIARRPLERVCKALGRINSWEKWQFFTSPTLALANRTPLEALRDGDIKLVLAAAEGFAE